MNLHKNFFGLIMAIVLVILVGSASAATRYELSTVPLKRNDYNLHLSKLKVADSTPNKNILLIHGLTYSSHEFDVDFGDYSLVKFLARKGYAVWRLDLTRYGQSDVLDDGFKINSDYAAEDINAAVDKIDVERIDLLGWSFGTVSVGKFAAKYPEKIRKLVLYAPIFNGLGVTDIKESFNANTWEHAADDFQKLSNGTINFDIVEPAVANTFLSNCWRYDKNTSPNGCRREICSSEDTRLIFMEKIKNPVLIIEGSRDLYINRASLSKVVKNLQSDCEFIEIEGGSHVVMIEKPYYKKFRNAVLRFLAD